MYGQEIRLAILNARARGVSILEISKVLGVSQRTVTRYIKLDKENGDISPKTKGNCGKKSIIDDIKLGEISDCIQNNPKTTLKELTKTLNLTVSESQLSRILKKLGYTYNKHTSAYEKSE